MWRRRWRIRACEIAFLSSTVVRVVGKCAADEGEADGNAERRGDWSAGRLVSVRRAMAVRFRSEGGFA